MQLLPKNQPTLTYQLIKKCEKRSSITFNLKFPQIKIYQSNFIFRGITTDTKRKVILQSINQMSLKPKLWLNDVNLVSVVQIQQEHQYQGSLSFLQIKFCLYSCFLIKNRMGEKLLDIFLELTHTSDSPQTCIYSDLNVTNDFGDQKALDYYQPNAMTYALFILDQKQ
ncbi:unnamed protein product [Paramecium octaurelia]|uniref:Uncharacterized protein n=1 Tax=Paramecium octaurelia TaxID=43137 RepID=A0A8S1W8Y6_PAROT|nr:unnamed protein product [Paramecium octaurelia]